MRGLIVGKFYPPHRGHHHLIATARAQVDELTVIVCQKPHEQPPGEQRVAWLREVHLDTTFLLIDDTYDEQDSRVWAENSIRWLGGRPDVVFTSEDYGERFAHFLECRHVLVDKSRVAVPVSGTAVRNDPFRNWDYLEPPVRAWYAKRVCIVGAESTGKTTLAQDLAQHFQTTWVPEYGREYSEDKLRYEGGYNWRSEEFAHIARSQCEREDLAARAARHVLICDTDAFATSIWHRRYFGERSAAVESIAAEHRRPDLYLLTDIGTPFVQDGTRDGESIRQWMHETFVDELKLQHRHYREIAGSREDRLQIAITLIDRLVYGQAG